MKSTPKTKTHEQYERELNRLLSQEIGNEKEVELFVTTHLAHLSAFGEESPTSAGQTI